MWKYSGKFLQLIFSHGFITICLQVDIQAVPDWYRTLHTVVGFIQTGIANHGKLLLSQLSIVVTHCKFQRQTNGQKNKIKHRQDSKSKVPLWIAVPVWQEVSPLGPQPQYAWNCPISKDNKLFSSDIGLVKYVASWLSFLYLYCINILPFHTNDSLDSQDHSM